MSTSSRIASNGHESSYHVPTEDRSKTAIALSGFNNLSKMLSVGLYQVRVAKSATELTAYQFNTRRRFSSRRIDGHLKKVVSLIDANLISLTRQDYEPQGASSLVLVSESPVPRECVTERPHSVEDSLSSVNGHLDKSHVSAHTYLDLHRAEVGLTEPVWVCTCRVDIDVSTCGHISPLRALDSLVGDFDPDVAHLDFRVRGFTRDVTGNKVFADHGIESLQDFLSTEQRKLYRGADTNVRGSNWFTTKLLRRETDLSHYLVGEEFAAHDLYEAGPAAVRTVEQLLRGELNDVFDGGAPPPYAARAK